MTSSLMAAREMAFRIVIVRDDGEPWTPVGVVFAIGFVVVLLGTKIVLQKRFLHLPEQTRRIIVIVVLLLYLIIASAIAVAANR